MKETQIKAYGKINLTLDVLRKRPDGYHEVEMVMQSIELHDHITLQIISGDGIEISTNHPLVPDDERNLAFKAVKLLKDEFKFKTGIKVIIKKNIPVAAGLAGGSTNAAAVLVGLNNLLNLGLSKKDLIELGKKLGSDVPFCILGGTALAKGTGTDLFPLPSLPILNLILVKPSISVSTKEIYSNYTPEIITKRPDIERMIDYIKNGDVSGIKEILANVLEDITFNLYPEVSETKKLLKDIGLNSVLMSGSGPTLFAIVDSEKEAERYATGLKEWINGEIIVTRTRQA